QTSSDPNGSFLVISDLDDGEAQLGSLSHRHRGRGDRIIGEDVRASRGEVERSDPGSPQRSEVTPHSKIGTHVTGQ
ncbi:hypothetical protein QP572_15145, partial [Brevibacterium sp. UMB10442]|nr:hypothetical protein [Brevibacterium sp. UMB10442]